MKPTAERETAALLCAVLREVANDPEARHTWTRDRAAPFMERLQVRFSVGGKGYTYELDKHWPLYIDGGPEYHQSAEIRLLEQGAVVCSLSAVQDPADSHADEYAYLPGRIVIHRAGDWLYALLRMAGLEVEACP